MKDVLKHNAITLSLGIGTSLSFISSSKISICSLCLALIFGLFPLPFFTFGFCLLFWLVGLYGGSSFESTSLDVGSSSSSFARLGVDFVLCKRVFPSVLSWYIILSFCSNVSLSSESDLFSGFSACEEDF